MSSFPFPSQNPFGIGGQGDGDTTVGPFTAGPGGSGPDPCPHVGQDGGGDEESTAYDTALTSDGHSYNPFGIGGGLGDNAHAPYATTNNGPMPYVNHYGGQDGDDDNTVSSVLSSTKPGLFKDLIADPIKKKTKEGLLLLTLEPKDVWYQFPQLHKEYDKKTFLRTFTKFKNRHKGKLDEAIQSNKSTIKDAPLSEPAVNVPKLPLDRSKSKPTQSKPVQSSLFLDPATNVPKLTLDRPAQSTSSQSTSPVRFQSTSPVQPVQFQSTSPVQLVQFQSTSLVQLSSEQAVNVNANANRLALSKQKSMPNVTTTSSLTSGSGSGGSEELQAQIRMLELQYQISQNNKEAEQWKARQQETAVLDRCMKDNKECFQVMAKDNNQVASQAIKSNEEGLHKMISGNEKIRRTIERRQTLGGTKGILMEEDDEDELAPLTGDGIPAFIQTKPDMCDDDGVSAFTDFPFGETEEESKTFVTATSKSEVESKTFVTATSKLEGTDPVGKTAGESKNFATSLSKSQGIPESTNKTDEESKAKADTFVTSKSTLKKEKSVKFKDITDDDDENNQNNRNTSVCSPSKAKAKSGLKTSKFSTPTKTKKAAPPVAPKTCPGPSRRSKRIQKLEPDLVLNF